MAGQGKARQAKPAERRLQEAFDECRLAVEVLDFKHYKVPGKQWRLLSVAILGVLHKYRLAGPDRLGF